MLRPRHYHGLLLGLLFFSIHSWASPVAQGPHIQVNLLSEHTALVPGEVNWLGVHLQPEAHWHTYWLNPGDSGEPPKLQWTVTLSEQIQRSQEVSMGEIHWPIPEAIPVSHLVNYGYNGESVLMIPLTMPADIATEQTLTVKLAISWLVCKEDCIPGWGNLSLVMPIAAEGEMTSQSSLFRLARERWPQSHRLTGHYEDVAESLVLKVDMKQLNGNWQVFPLRDDVIQHNQPQTFRSLKAGGTFVLAKSDYYTPKSALGAAGQAQSPPLAFLVSDGKQAFYLDAVLNDINPGDAENPSLPLMLLFALFGGLILNVMPCVLPVLAIKAISLQQRHSTTQVKLAYLLGVMSCFIVFALVIIAMKGAGSSLGWGFHMQSPVVIASLSFLFVYLALVLLDIAPGGEQLAGTGQSLTQGQSFRSQFYTGVLAVLVASPCTAPFMGAALGAAMVTGPLESLLIFMALGFGFALPMTGLALSPRLIRYLPKPGAWMTGFRQFLAFPMLATVLWLLWIFESQTSPDTQLIFMAILLIFAMAFWLLKSGLAQLAYFTLLVALGAGYAVTQRPPESTHKIAGISEAWSPDRLQALRDNNQVVLVNMTADWCITCKVNEQVVLSGEPFERLVNQPGVHYLVGDWTNKNSQILDFLQQYERVGVPLYVLYGGNHYQRVLPQLLTLQILETAIQQAQETL